MIKINARDCDIISVDKKTEREFLDNNHTQGFVKGSSVAYGFMYNGEIVQIMTFGKPRYSKRYGWELLRDCTKKGYIVRGGVSKLWKFFIDNNHCNSCICYSYEHNNRIVNKYIDYCGFYNTKRSKSAIKPFWIGDYNGKHYNIPINNLRKYGVDRILGTHIGFEKGNNENILSTLGFRREYKEIVYPQIDTYYPFSVVYRVDDLTDGSFYIGMCESKSSWDNGYLGSGSKWSKHLVKHKDHKYKRTVIKSNFKTPQETSKFESKEISKVLKDKHNYNLTAREQGRWEPGKPCQECGNIGRHSATCSKRNEKTCEECGSVCGHHKKSCSKYNEPIRCHECGGTIISHKKWCSMYNSPKPCPECGGIKGHKAGCSKKIVCPECGSVGTTHKKICSKYKEPKISICLECGAKGGQHKDWCSKSVGVCSYCGYSLKSNRHSKDCPLYKDIRKNNSVCTECGGKCGHHKKTCSQYKNITCSECGGTHGQHKNYCSKYKDFKCQECGGIHGHHKPWCSMYKELKCPECGGLRGNHHKTCSRYKRNK